jgi:uroporphyrinogen III methyltransferase/synthase
VIVTRDQGQSPLLAEPLEELGAEILFVPVIAIADPSEASELGQAIERLHTYDWLIFTSVNGVRHFVEALDRSDRDLRSLKAKICTIGPATRAAVEALHLRVDVMPKEYVAESLLEALATEDLKGKRVLLPRAAVARDLVPVALTERGAHVDVVEAYRTIMPPEAPERARAALARNPEWITFTSSSTVKNLVAALAPDDNRGITGAEALRQFQAEGGRIASIGPITSATVRDFGLRVDAEADPHTIEGLVAAIASHKST